jgi:hypothetical protein
MNTNNNTHLEYLEVKRLLTQMATMLNMIIPPKVSVSYIAESTCKSRESIRQYLLNNFQPEKDFWKEGGKIFVNKEVAITLLSRYNNKNLTLAA